MGEEFGGLFYELNGEFMWACLKWQQHEDLFGSPETVDLLNRSAPAFFGSLQQILREDVLLHVSRLTDAPRIGDRKNLSLKRLKGHITDPSLRNQIDGLLDIVEQRTGIIRRERNKRLAHLDEQAREVQVPTLASRRQVKEALEAIAGLMNAINMHYRGGPTSYEYVIGPLGGVSSLLSCLKQAVEARDNERGRRRAPVHE
jgi:hypothetical protein